MSEHDWPLTPAEAARLLGWSAVDVARAAADGTLASTRLGRGTAEFRVPAHAVDALMSVPSSR